MSGLGVRDDLPAVVAVTDEVEARLARARVALRQVPAGVGFGLGLRMYDVWDSD